MKKTQLFLLLAILITSVTINAQEKNKYLYNAILVNDIDKVSKLLKDSADANYVYTSKNPEAKISMLTAAVNKKSINMVKLLLEHGADVNFRDSFNVPPILYAASTGSKALVELLLTHGADINANDGQGNNVLTAAKESKNTALINFVKEKLKK